MRHQPSARAHASPHARPLPYPLPATRQTTPARQTNTHHPKTAALSDPGGVPLLPYRSPRTHHLVSAKPNRVPRATQPSESSAGERRTYLTNHPKNRYHTTRTPRSADHALPTPTAPDIEATNSTGDTATTPPAEAEGVPHPRQGTPARRSQPDARRVKRRTTGTMAGTVPTPEQWAQEQLKNAPTRSRAWARAVAAIYGLDVREE